MKPLALDLCCGLGGWTRGFLKAGWDVVGVDIKRFNKYPADQIVADVTTLVLPSDIRPQMVVASPPCEEFSRHDQPWTRKKNPPPPDLSIWRACERIAASLHVPIVIENVRGAQRFMGASAACVGSFHLWRDIPPGFEAINWGFTHTPKRELSGRQRAERAKVPLALSFTIARLWFWKLT